jgi:hypothetical protein
MKIHRRRPLTYDWNRACRWSVNNFGTEMKSLTRMEMTNTSNDKARQKRHKREKATIEHLVDKVYEDEPAEGRLQNSTTDSGLPVEEQLRKEWDPKKGGLPTF